MLVSHYTRNDQAMWFYDIGGRIHVCSLVHTAGYWHREWRECTKDDALAFEACRILAET